MFPINANTDAIINAREIHIRNVYCRLSQKVLGRKCRKEGCTICKTINHYDKKLTTEVRQVFEDQALIENIIGCQPKDMIGHYETFLKKVDAGFSWTKYESYLMVDRDEDHVLTTDETDLINLFDPINKWICELFDYEKWFQNRHNRNRYDAYELAFNLDRNTCCYCNRMYTATIKSNYGKKVMRPVYDHWYPQYKYPLLALSFYNLIPSCTICNSSIKGKKLPDIERQLHPYTAGDILNNFRFSFDYQNDTDHFLIKTIVAADDPILRDTLADQKLELLYQAHPTELADMLTMAKAYNPDYVQQIIDLFPDHSLSHEEAYRLAFGTELNPTDFHLRPLSKFRSDILTELQLISRSKKK